MATFAVGDIQGCYDEFQSLLECIRFSDSDQLWLAGDLINRGPKNVETLRFVKALGRRAIVVLGNHDLHALACWFGERSPNKKDTFDDIFSANDADELMFWLQNQALLHRDEHLGYTMVHAGIPPNWTISFAQARAREVESSLRSSGSALFFDNMYGNTPNHWSDSLCGHTRLRVITNYFTRMRFCTPLGELEFSSKGDPNHAPKGYRPWYAHSSRECANERILFGHWAALLGATEQANAIGLDTGCVWGGRLTALRLEDQERFSVDCCSLRAHD